LILVYHSPHFKTALNTFFFVSHIRVTHDELDARFTWNSSGSLVSECVVWNSNTDRQKTHKLPISSEWREVS